MGAFGRNPVSRPIPRDAYAPGEGRRDVIGADEAARWGNQQVVQFSIDPAAPGQAPPHQFVNAHSKRPQVWGVFLSSNLTSGVQSIGNVTVTYNITVGVGQTSTTIQYQFRYDGTLVAPAETYNQLATPFPQVFKELEFPAREIKIQAICAEQGLGGQQIIIDVGAYVAPRTLVY